MKRPHPPAHLREVGCLVEPAPVLAEWLFSTFINDGAPLLNPEHEHLRDASVGCLWSNVPNERRQRQIVGTAEMFSPQGSVWQKARAEQQVREWFGDVPDFIITIYAPHAFKSDDANFCALVEHELMHCAQAKDEFGSPRFRKDGSPVFALRSHDVEEFVGIVARYGVDAGGVRALVNAAKAKPILSGARIGQACGTCALRAA